TDQVLTAREPLFEDIELLEDGPRQLFAGVETRRAVQRVAQPFLEGRVHAGSHDAVDVRGAEPCVQQLRTNHVQVGDSPSPPPARPTATSSLAPAPTGCSERAAAAGRHRPGTR